MVAELLLMACAKSQLVWVSLVLVVSIVVALSKSNPSFLYCIQLTLSCSHVKSECDKPDKGICANCGLFG